MPSDETLRKIQELQKVVGDNTITLRHAQVAKDKADKAQQLALAALAESKVQLDRAKSAAGIKQGSYHD